MSDLDKSDLPKSVFLGSIKLTGFRGFRDGTKISFMDEAGRPAQWTVILGENGTAKTGVLQAIAAMAPVYDETLAREILAGNSVKIKKDESPPGWRPKATNGSEWIPWWYRNRPRNRQIKSADTEFSVEFCSSKSGIGSASRRRTGEFKDLPKAFDWKAGATFTESPNSGVSVSFSFTSVGGASLGNFKLFGYGASRLVEFQEPRSTSRQSADSLFSNFDVIDSPERWLVELDHLMRLEDDAEQKQRAEKAYESAKRCICAVLPDITDIEVKKASRSLSSNSTVRARFKCPYGWVFFEELGQGYQSMASWAIDLLQQLHRIYAHMEKPETGAAVVLIDEFDLHLHPKWQLSLMEHLGGIFTNCQFIITAHSPLLVQAAGPNANIVVFRRDACSDGTNWIIVDSDPVRVRGWRLDQIITSDLFGLSSARPKKYSELFERRARLSAKANRSDQENQELSDITRTLESEAPPSISRTAAEILAELRASK